ncbi:hypothetical protein B0H14DRAFT_2789358 [Mycena olivaceomarginata]|nr:hypothetical protein B0H14DRAFT_2789358 [Mycena olivaceomarginata]
MHYIHRVLCKVTYDKFNIEQAADFQIYNPADESKVTACDDGLGDPADDVFQWDFSSGYTESRWNKLMTAKIVDQVLEDDGEDGPLAEAGIERGFLEELMADKLVRYRGEWKRFQPRYTESLGRVETTQEARARGAQAFQQHQLAYPKHFFQNTHKLEYEDRVQTITATVEIKRESGITLDVETWERLLEIEEDEIEVDDGKVLVYRVKLCIWREPRIVEYFRFVDAQTALFKKHQRGPTAATRIRSGAHGSSKAPCGLPKSLYNSEWLKKATPSYLKELKVSKEAFELFVAATNRMEL